MADEEQLAIVKKGVDVWNHWVKENLEAEIDLRDADLRGADLEGADFENAYLWGASLEGANLMGAMLCSTKLQGANLEGAYLKHANLLGAWLAAANLRHADLEDAHLLDADLEGALLEGANLSSACLEGAELRSASLEGANLGSALSLAVKFEDVDLRKVEGLAEVVHDGPSSLDRRTLAKSRGQIPEVFLRGCGFQDWEIAAAKLHDPELSGEEVTDIAYEIVRLKGESPIQINPLFISYSREDSCFVEILEPRFDEKHIRYWRDVHDSTAGPIEEQIERAIRVNPIFLLVLSKHSVESDWVRMEVEKARRLAKELSRRGEERHVLCPVALDGAWKAAPWPERLMLQVKDYNVLDFSGWEDEEMLGGMFGRLLEGLGIYYRQSE